VDQWKESDTVSLVWVRLVKGIEDGPFMWEEWNVCEGVETVMGVVWCVVW